jgi:hypothetical protein
LTPSASAKRIKRVLRVDKRGGAARLLCFRDDMQRNGGFTGRFRPEKSRRSSARNAAHAEGVVQRQTPVRNGCNGRACGRIAKFHIAPLPNCFSICPRAISSAFSFSTIVVILSI